MTKPDFIIIGAMKSATSTLHEQLALQPGIFMSTPKEPNFFSDDDIFAKGSSWYESLFADADSGDLCGESSTHYTKLPDYPLTVTRMKNALPSIKCIYVIRHPIQRLVSHYIHQWSQNVIRTDINKAVDLHPELINYSLYSMQLKPFIDAYGAENILIVFSESIRYKPQQELERVARFLGYSAEVIWQKNLPEQNVSNQRVRKFKGYGFIVDNPLMAFVRRVIVPQKLRDYIKQMLVMKKRPELSDATIKKLNDIFDKDLRKLSQMTDEDISLDNYLSLAQSTNISLRLNKDM